MSSTVHTHTSEKQPGKKAKAYTLAVMFADVSGSTRLFEQIGDTMARRAIAELMIDAIKVIRGHKGKVVKTIGDEVMCVYTQPADSVASACEIHELLEEKTFGDQQMTMRIGIHYGTMLYEKVDGTGDFYGDGVNVAARMVAQAKSGQTIISQDVMDKLSADNQEHCRFVDTAPIKGKQEAINIYEVIWKQEDATCMAIPALATTTAVANSEMLVSYKGKAIKVCRQMPAVIIGRSKTCDVPVNEELASRNHVRLELRRDKFFLIDQSTNGTYVRNVGGDEMFLRREEILLTGDGDISLGRAFSEQPEELVQFSQNEAAG